MFRQNSTNIQFLIYFIYYLYSKINVIKEVVKMPDTQDGGYILDDNGLKPYSVDDEDESRK